MGVLAIRVPNGAFYAAVRRRLDGIAGPIARALLAHNNLLGFPYRHGFTVQSLTLLLEDTGFDVVRTTVTRSCPSPTSGRAGGPRRRSG